ncbi:MAG TPA: sensor histidine kinase [Streptosporangiaceae bacterium]|nr:sensor histidine kinase [Streptosporangiaceae bacterium]
MSAKADAPAGWSGLEEARDRQLAVAMSIRLLATAIVAFVVVASFQAHPAPGIHGRALAVALALAALCATTVAALWTARASRYAPLLALSLIAVASAVSLIVLQGTDAAFLGVFPAVCVAALALAVRVSAVVAAFALVAVSGAWVYNGHTSVTGCVLNDFGVLAFYILSLFARRLRESQQQAESLLAELEQTRAAQAQAAALGERQRLAREMHDVLAHSLSGLMLNLEGARLLTSQDGTDPRVRAAVERAHRLARTGLDEAQRAIRALRGDALPGPERLPDLAAGFEADTGVPCTISVTGDERDLSAEARLAFYRAGQEALTNIRKHAHEQRVEVRLAYEPAGTRLAIEDFGQGGPPATRGEGKGYGLTGMEERAELLGGTLTAGPTQTGFLVELWIPA